MRSLVVSVLAAQVVLLAAQFASAQTAFEQLEQQVRSAVGQPAAGQVPAGQPAAAQEPGYLGLIADDRQTSGKGIRVMEIVSGGPAEQAGLKTGDLITGVNNQAVHSMDDFARTMSTAPAAAKLSFEIQRDGATQAIDAVLSKRRRPTSGAFSNSVRYRKRSRRLRPKRARPRRGRDCWACGSRRSRPRCSRPCVCRRWPGH